MQNARKNCPLCHKRRTPHHADSDWCDECVDSMLKEQETLRYAPEHPEIIRANTPWMRRGAKR